MERHFKPNVLVSSIGQECSKRLSWIKNDLEKRSVALNESKPVVSRTRENLQRTDM
jgi:hypothetical protein